VINGLAVAPPDIVLSIGVSTSKYPFSSNILLISLIILLLFIIALKFVFIDHYAKYYGIVNAIFWIISLIIFVKVVGVKRDNSVVKSNVTQVVIISTLLFILLSFLSGLFFGFLKNAYSLKPMSILKNIYSLVIMIIAEEYIRGIVNNVCVKDKKPLFILTFLYIILDVWKQAAASCIIYVDVNGRKGPNMFGKDTFTLMIYRGKLQPYYANRGIDTVKKECVKGAEWGSITCAALIIHDGWQITKDYPW